MEMTEERVSQCDEKSIEMIPSEERKRKKMKGRNTTSRICGTISKGIIEASEG